MFVPESLKNQNELIRTLRKQLEAKERELADQQWILQQYLQSPSWRLTRPLRWLAQRLRAGRVLLFGSDNVALPPAVSSPASNEEISAVEDDFSFGLKNLFTSHYSILLETFLSSGGSLQLPNGAAPRV